MKILDDLNIIKTLDDQDMYHKIVHLPEQILQSYENAKIHNMKLISKSQDINRIIICGMGGSAISADIAKAAFEQIIPIEVVKYYNLPYLDEKTLVITISYSGNTEETISCLQQAIKKTKHIGAITAGGEMQELVKDKFPWIELQSGFPPRSAIGRLFFSLLRLLEEFEIIPNQAEIVKKTVAQLIKKAGSICLDIASSQNLAKLSAEQINDKIPIIYSSDPKLFSLAYRWKCQINENAKYPAFSNTLPEMNHNEIEGWEVKGFSGKLLPIFLGGMQEKPQIQKRNVVLKKLFKEHKIDYLEFFVEGNSLIEQIFSLIYLGDMVSYYLAILQNVNPTSIDFIDHLKRNL
jgi:glucose/mannose-6-phosphate isomerase